MPSNTARGGGIVLPVVNSIATTLGSTPTHDSKLGAFLMLVGSHSNLLSASMYLTGMILRGKWGDGVDEQQRTQDNLGYTMLLD